MVCCLSTSGRKPVFRLHLAAANIAISSPMPYVKHYLGACPSTLVTCDTQVREWCLSNESPMTPT
jgi:hypothetical protein